MISLLSRLQNPLAPPTEPMVPKYPRKRPVPQPHEGIAIMVNERAYGMPGVVASMLHDAVRDGECMIFMRRYMKTSNLSGICQNKSVRRYIIISLFKIIYSKGYQRTSSRTCCCQLEVISRSQRLKQMKKKDGTQKMMSCWIRKT